MDFLGISYEFPPQLLAGAIWTGKLLEGLHDQGWQFEVLTGVKDGFLSDGIPVHHVANPRPSRVIRAAQRLRLGKLVDALVWPDDTIFWTRAAVRRGLELIRERRPALILNFMMPYGAGLVGAELKRRTGLPLVYCLSDSLSCTDMIPFFPSYVHYKLARRLEDDYVRQADAVVYVSQFNADLVKSRQPADQAHKFHVVRLGASPEEFAPLPDGPTPAADRFRIIYVGGMGGWYEFYTRHPRLSRLRKLVDGFGRYHVTRLDHSTHTPVYVARAAQQVMAARPEWRGKITVEVFGAKTCPDWQIRAVLDETGVADVVRVHGPVPRHEIGRQVRTADLLFQCIQARTDGTPGGRIASKTYEYLMSDRPILAAVPQGENWDYYADKPGVSLVGPHDVGAMARAIEDLCARKFEGRPASFDRSPLRHDLSYANRAAQLATVLKSVLARNPQATAEACSR